MFCKAQLGELQRNLALIKGAGLGLATVSYDSQAALQDFAARKGITFPLLSDHESEVIRAYKVVDQRFGPGAQLNVDSSGEVPVSGLAYSSVFVLNPDGTIAWRFVSEHEELRLTAGSILQRSLKQFAGEIRTPIDSGTVHIEVKTSDTVASLGSRLTLGVELAIPRGWHTYGSQVQGGYHGTTWRMDESECSIVGDVEYPEPHSLQLAFANESLPVYSGTIRLTREFVVKPMISDQNPAVWEQFRKRCLGGDASFPVSGSLEFQVCNDHECLPPRSVPLKWRFAFTPPDRERVPLEHWRAFEP